MNCAECNHGCMWVTFWLVGPGLIDGYSGERRVLEEQVREGMTLQQQLEAELQMTNSQLQELQQERPDFSEQQDLLLRQQDSMKGGATEAELSMLHHITHSLHTHTHTFLTHTLTPHTHTSLSHTHTHTLLTHTLSHSLHILLTHSSHTHTFLSHTHTHTPYTHSSLCILL